MTQDDLADLALTKHISRLFSDDMRAHLVSRLIRNAYEAGFTNACERHLAAPRAPMEAHTLDRDSALVEYFQAGHLDPDPLADKVLKGEIDGRTLAIVHAAAVSLAKPKPLRRK